MTMPIFVDTTIRFVRDTIYFYIHIELLLRSLLLRFVHIVYVVA